MHSFSNHCDGVHYPCMDVFKRVGLSLAKWGCPQWCVLSVHSCVSVMKACFWSNRWPSSNTVDNNLPYLWNKRNPFTITAGHIPTGHIAVTTTAGNLPMASLKVRVQSVSQKPVPVRGGVHELQLSKDLLSLFCPWRNRKDTYDSLKLLTTMNRQSFCWSRPVCMPHKSYHQAFSTSAISAPNLNI